jgi:hypothetical protein
MHKRGASAISKVTLPQEVWSQIKAFLPEMSPRVLVRTFHFRLGIRPKEFRYSYVWDTIFKDYKWLTRMTEMGYNPVLVGTDLEAIYNADKNNANNDAQIFLMLLGGEGWSQRDSTAPDPVLLDSIRPFKRVSKYNPDIYEQQAEEVVILGSNIRLSIRDISNRYAACVTLSRPERLFQYCNGLYSNCLYWKDEHHSLRMLGPEDILALPDRPDDWGMPLNTLCSKGTRAVANLCSVKLRHPGKNERRAEPWEQLVVGTTAIGCRIFPRYIDKELVLSSKLPIQPWDGRKMVYDDIDNVV